MPLANDVVTKLQDIVDTALVGLDETKQLHRELWKIYKVHIDEGPFLIGVVANYPQAIVQHPDLRNIPRRENLALGGCTNPWQLPVAGGVRPGDLLLGQPGRAQHLRSSDLRPGSSHPRRGPVRRLVRPHHVPAPVVD